MYKFQEGYYEGNFDPKMTSFVRYAVYLMNMAMCVTGIEEVCVLDLPQLNVHFKWPLKVLKEILKEPGQLEPRPSVVKAYSESELPKLTAFVESQLPSDPSKGAEAAVTSFLFLYASILG